MNPKSFLLSLPENSRVEIPGPEAVEILKKIWPQEKPSENCIEEIHMTYFGNTNWITRPIKK